ncbi:hypothetical protein WJX81_004892 [Elliptochloris bilobata]|uniref:Uncharacterized protein n=1 Tax=Elliptochloris bilobata TaxID=381761 RepID=A0AAW1RP44_9CHLO
MQQSAFQQQKLAAYDTRQNAYQNGWKTSLTSAVAADCPWCCFAMLCPSVVSYFNRKRALRNDMTRYICCNGDCPCSGRMSEQSCPEACLCAEVWCCFTQSVASTRWMIQDEMRIQNTQCDNCLIGCMVATQYLACLCNIAACLSGSEEINELANCTDNIAQLSWCTVCACMQTQAHVQLEERDRGAGVAPQHDPYAAPQQQTMGYPNQPPPQAMYQQGYLQGPPQGYPQGPPQGYPGMQQMGR